MVAKTKLTSLRLAGWKSIKETDPPIRFGDVNVLIGANGSGKSNLLSFFRLLKELAEERLQVAIGRAGGADSLLFRGVKETQSLKADLTFESEGFDSTYRFRLEPTVQGSMTFKNERMDSGSLRYEHSPNMPESWFAVAASVFGDQIDRMITERLRLIASAMSGFSAYHFHDTSWIAGIRRDCYVHANDRLYTDGGNLAAMLYLYQERHPVVARRILSTVRLIAPTVSEFVIKPQPLNEHNVILKWRGRGSTYEFGPHQFSDGTLRVIALATLLLQPEGKYPPLLSIDEPELGLHPSALSLVAGLIKKASRFCQVVVATQSAALLDHFDPADVIVVNVRDGTSTFERLPADALAGWLEDYSLGNLWERNVFGGGPYS